MQFSWPLVISIIIAILFIANTYAAFRIFRKEKDEYFDTIKRIRPIMIPETFATIVLVICTVLLIEKLVPPLSWGWFQLLPIEGTNYIDGPMTQAVESKSKIGLYVILAVIIIV